IYSFIKTTSKPETNKNLSNYIEYNKEVLINIPIFNDAVNAFGLALGGGGNYLISIEENKNEFIIMSRRYGHGIGMSQRGAEQMAKEGLSYNNILSFYYPGIKLFDYLKKETNLELESLTTKDPFLQYSPEPLPSPTPLPTPMPLLINVPDEVQVLLVDNIEKDSFLNLREQPGTGFGVVLRLYYGQELLLVESLDNGWLHVILNGSDVNTIIEGYVMEEFVSFKK
ncbi:MAG: SH3 domain-containing protein, partial [Christensenellaceae bacterium]|nr:SH3 domain-containing protein [Christensenellaceae bacterium]